MCRFSPFEKFKGHPEGNCKNIISETILDVNKDIKYEKNT